MIKGLHRVAMVALLMGSAILLFSCKPKTTTEEESLDGVRTEECHDLTLIMSENGRKSYIFTSPLLEGYMLGRDPYREFRKGIAITTYQDDSLTTVNAELVANYAIYYEKRKLWEAKGDVVITKHDGTKVYTQQLFWNSATKRIYSNVDTKLVTATDEIVGEGFESDEEMNEPRFRRWKGRMQVDMEEIRKEQQEAEEVEEEGDGLFPGEPGYKPKPEPKNDAPASKPAPKPETKPETKPQPKPGMMPAPKPGQTPPQKPGQPAQKPGQRPIPPQLQRGARPPMPPQRPGGSQGAAQPPMQKHPEGAAPSQNTTK